MNGQKISPHNELALILISAIAVGSLNLAADIFEPLIERLYPLRKGKTEQYQRFLHSDSDPAIILVGSSTTLMGIDSTILEDQIELPFYNAGQLGYAPVGLAVEVVRELVNNERALGIVYGLDAFSLSAPVPPRTKIDAHRRGPHFLWNYALYRNRSVLFDWVSHGYSGRWIDPRDAWERHFRNGQRFLTFEGFDLGPSGYAEMYGYMDPAWPNFTGPKSKLRSRNVAGLKEIVAICATANIPLVLVQMPHYQRSYDELAEAHQITRRFLAGFVQENALTYLDYSLAGSFPHQLEDRFFDINHLNFLGAPLFTSKLADRLRTVFAESGFD